MSQSLSPAEGRKSWRGGPQTNLLRRSRNVWRWILSGLAILLIGWMVWVFIPRPTPRILLLTFSDQREDRHTIPPVPSAKDIEALLGWAGAVNVPVCQLPLSEIDKLRRWAGAGSAGTGATSEMQFSFGADRPSSNVAPRAGDTLVIYIKGHGLAVDLGTASEPDVQPVLIKSLTDAALAGEWLRDSDSVVKVADLLADLAARKDVRSVVLLDAVHLGYDPRLGVLANGFPEAVRQAMQKILPADAANVWVVLGSANGELSADDPSTGRSALIAALTSVLERQAGEAKTISLGAVVQEVAASLAQQPRGPRDALALTPQLVEPPGALAARSRKNSNKVPELPQFVPILPDAEKGKSAELTSKLKDEAARAAKVEVDRAIYSVPRPTLPAVQLTTAQPPTPAAAPAPDKAATTAKAPAAPATDAPPPAPKADPAAAAAALASSPTAAPPAVSTPAAPAPASPVEKEDPQAANLYLAWQLRDRLLRGAGNQAGETWSPLHLAPHWWRRLERILVGYDEQMVGSRSASVADPQTLQLLVGDLQNLASAVTGGAGSAPVGPECRAIAEAFRQFHSANGGGGAPLAARQSFQSRSPGGLDDANAALKTFAECSFRAVDTIELHGRLASVTDGGPAIEELAGELLARLVEMRSKLDPRSMVEGRLDDRRIQEIKRLAAALGEVRERLDAEITQYVRSAVAPPLSPGKLLRIRLLLESPLLAADDRRLLRRAVIQRPAGEALAATTDVSTSGRSSAAANLPARIRANLALWRSLLRLVEPQSNSGDNLGGAPHLSSGLAVQLADSKLPRGAEASDLRSWASVGRKLSEFDEALPRQIQNDYLIRREKRAEPTPPDMLGLYLLLLLVDGRDAGRFSRSAPLVCLAQPLLPAKIPDRIQLTAEPSQLQLALGERDGAELKLAIAVQSENLPPFQVPLELRWTPAADVRVVRDGTDEEISPGALPAVPLDTNERTLTFRVFPRRQDDSVQSAKVSLVARGSFAKSEPAEARATMLLPRPNRVDLSVASLRASDRGSKPLGGDQGGRLMLFPNRTGTYQLYVRNLSSEARKLHAKLYRVPFRAVPGTGRLFDPHSPTSLLKQFEDLSAKIRGATTSPAADLRDMLVAQTSDKAPLDLPANQVQPVAVPFEAAPPPPAPAGQPAGPSARTDVSTGLVLVLSSADGKDQQPYIKWIELAPYLPDELYEIRRPSYRNGRLSFAVGLKDPRQADELGLGQQPLKIQWDRRALPARIEEGQFEALVENASREPELWARVPENVAGLLYVQLHIDDYPRALVSEFERDSSGSLKHNNWKRDRDPAVHLGKLALSHAKTVYEIEPHEEWLPFPVPTLMPLEGFRYLSWQRTTTSPIFADIGTLQQVPLAVDLQADVAPRYFADGGAVRVLVGSQELYSFGFDRRVSVYLAGIEGGALKLENQVADWSNLSLPIAVEAKQDRIVEVVAQATEGGRRSDISQQRLKVVLDRNLPDVSPAEAQPDSVNPLSKPRIMLRCRASDGRDGSGIERVEFVVGFDQNGNNRLDETERQPPWQAAAAGPAYQAEIGVPDERKEGTYLVEAVAYDFAGHRAVAPSLGAFETRIPAQGSKTKRSTFGGSKEKDEPVGGKKAK